MLRFAALSTALLMAACGGKLTPEQARSALPRPEDARVGTPSAPAAVAGALAASPNGEAAALVSNSDFFRLTGALAASVNGGVGAILLVLRAVVELPPTKCEGDTCTWGPGSSPLDYNVFELVVRKVGDHYEYQLMAEPKSQPGSGFIAFLSGQAWPGAAPRRGHGNFALDFDQVARLDGPHGDDTGRIEVQYDAAGPVVVDVQFLGMIDRNDPGDPANPNKVNAAYAFAASAAGGDLQVAWRTLPPNAAATLSLHSRWDGSGAGRGDAKFVGGGFTYTESECWAGGASSFALVYDTNPPSGSESACAFSPAEYASLAAP